MAGKARETYDESVTALHQWLQFLDDRQDELQAQLERLRNKGRGDEEEQAPASDKPDPWL